MCPMSRCVSAWRTCRDTLHTLHTPAMHRRCQHPLLHCAMLCCAVLYRTMLRCAVLCCCPPPCTQQQPTACRPCCQCAHARLCRCYGCQPAHTCSQAGLRVRVSLTHISPTTPHCRVMMWCEEGCWPRPGKTRSGGCLSPSPGWGQS